MPRASAPLAHGSGGAFVHDGRGFRRYTLLCSFLPRTLPAPCGLGVRSALFCRGRSLRPAGLESVLLFFAADVPCALRAWSPLVRAAVAALIPTAKKVDTFWPFCASRQCALGARLRRGLRSRRARLSPLCPALLFSSRTFPVPCGLGVRFRGPQSRPLYQRIQESFSVAAGIIPADQKSRCFGPLVFYTPRRFRAILGTALDKDNSKRILFPSTALV